MFCLEWWILYKERWGLPFFHCVSSTCKNGGDDRILGIGLDGIGVRLEGVKALNANVIGLDENARR